MDELVVRVCSCRFVLQNHMGAWPSLTFLGFSFMSSIGQLQAEHGVFSEQIKTRFILIKLFLMNLKIESF